MEVTSKTNYSISFNANLTKKTKQAGLIAASGIAILNSSNKQKDNDKFVRVNDNDVNTREMIIQSKIQDCIDSNTTVTVKRLAKELKMPLHLVITSIYRTKSNLRSLFDKVKNTNYLRKPTSNANKSAAQEMVENSKKYLAQSTNPPFENDYINCLGRKLDKLNLSQEEMDELKKIFTVKPALADLILFSRSKDDKSGSYVPNTIKTISAAHDINPELTESLVVEKRPDGHLYSLRDIYRIVVTNKMSPELLDYAKQNPQLLYKLSTVRMKNGKPRFGKDDIFRIMQSLKSDAEFTKFVITQKNGLTDYRFNGHQLRLILEVYDKYPHIVSHLINSQNYISKTQVEFKYSAYSIEKILEALISDDCEKIEKVLDFIRDDSYQGSRQYASATILNIIEKHDAKRK